MCRTVTDAAILLGAMVGVDPRDAATAASKGKSHADYTTFLDADGLRGMRIGIVRSQFGFSDAVDKLMANVVETLKSSGAEVIDPANVDTIQRIGDEEIEVLLYELKAGLNAYLASLGANAPVKTLKEVIDFNEKNAEKELR
jgi:amidase